MSFCGAIHVLKILFKNTGCTPAAPAFSISSYISNKPRTKMWVILKKKERYGF
jgi:hypothetical protein